VTLSQGTIASILAEEDITRRSLLRNIETITNSRVITYLANPNASPNFIDHNDPIFLHDVLESVGKTENLTLILDSPGGDVNIAEKITLMCRKFSESFKVLVPNAAKSAATIIALGSDLIMMGYLSEIGPIDPQIRVVSPQGQITFIPAQSLIDSIHLLDDAIKKGVDPRAVIALIQRLDPPLIDVADKSIRFARQLAEEWLSKYMLREDAEKAKEIATALSDNRRWLSHGRRIGPIEAMQLGLKIEIIPQETELWKLVWQYYSRALIHMNKTGVIKIFENREMTLNYSVTRERAPPTSQTPQ
jgi:hypothetical protein